MRHVKRFMPYGFLFAALTSCLFLYLGFRSPSEALINPGPAGPGSTTPSASTLQGMVLDIVDGKTVAKATLETVAPDGQRSSRDVSSADGLTWTILSGQGQIGQDPYTGRTLFEPSGNDPLVVQPAIGGQVGAPVTVGLNISSVPSGEQVLAVAGGGACAQNPNHAGLFRASVNVRSVVDTSVIPLSATERVLRYQRAEYYAYDPEAGPIRITLNPDHVSEIHLSSLQSAGSKSFFPASAEAHLYFIIEMLNSGVRIFNPEPMVLHTPSTNWPPFQEPMINDQPVSFVLVDNPSVEMMLIDSQESYLYPTKELAIDLLSQQVNSGVLEATYRIRNLTTTGGDVRWFFLGDVGAAQTPTRGVQTIPPGGQAQVTLRTQLQPSGLTQTITLGAVSQSGPRLTGERRLQLRYPAVAEPKPPAVAQKAPAQQRSGV